MRSPSQCPKVLDSLGPQSDGNPVFDEAGGRGSAAAPAAFVLGPRQVIAPGAVIGAADLGVDEAVDAFMADGGRRLLAIEPAGDLLGRPAELEAVQHEGAQLGIALQTRARPAAG